MSLIVGGILAGLFILEISLWGYRLVKYRDFDTQSLLSKRSDALKDLTGSRNPAEEPRFENRVVIHPLFGYTYNPEDEGINNFGFLTGRDVFLTPSGYSVAGSNGRGPDSLVVGIFGGSFADYVGREHKYLSARLKALFPTREPVILSMGVGGYAIPQTVFAYLYFRELFDIVVFIDGLNEVWNYVENNLSGFPPEFAKAQVFRFKMARQELSPEQFDRTAKIISLKKWSTFITRWSLMPPFKRRLVTHYLWDTLYTHWFLAIERESMALSQSYRTGRLFFEVPEEEILGHAARQWTLYHRLVHDVASREGSLSLHMLQPNPFVPNSKILTPEEDFIIHHSYPVEFHVLHGYPKLRTEVAHLKDKGVLALDLSLIYQETARPIWIDSAHPNSEGSRMVVDAIYDLIVANQSQLSVPASAH
ncbi:MAG: hypothetical protein AB7G48_02890 [Nitrospiraceae bacterium]